MTHEPVLSCSQLAVAADEFDATLQHFLSEKHERDIALRDWQSDEDVHASIGMKRNSDGTVDTWPLPSPAASRLRERELSLDVARGVYRKLSEAIEIAARHHDFGADAKALTVLRIQIMRLKSPANKEIDRAVEAAELVHIEATAKAEADADKKRRGNKKRRGTKKDGTTKVDQACNHIEANEGAWKLTPTALARIVKCDKSIFSHKGAREKIAAAKERAKANSDVRERTTGRSTDDHQADVDHKENWSAINDRLDMQRTNDGSGVE